MVSLTNSALWPLKKYLKRSTGDMASVLHEAASPMAHDVEIPFKLVQTEEQSSLINTGPNDADMKP